MSELTKEVINVLAKEEDDKILKEVLDYYVFVDLFCRHCDAELEVRISIQEELKLQINLTNCSVIDEPKIYYFEKDYGVN